GDRPDGVRLGDARAVARGFEPVAPDRPLAAALLGGEGELASSIRREDATASRPLHQAEGPAAVVPEERRVRRRTRAALGPPRPLALGAPLAHARHVGDEVVDAFRRRGDENGLAVLGQPPALVLRGHAVLLPCRLLGQAIGHSYSCQAKAVLSSVGMETEPG